MPFYEDDDDDFDDDFVDGDEDDCYEESEALTPAERNPSMNRRF